MKIWDNNIRAFVGITIFILIAIFGFCKAYCHIEIHAHMDIEQIAEESKYHRLDPNEFLDNISRKCPANDYEEDEDDE